MIGMIQMDEQLWHRNERKNIELARSLKLYKLPEDLSYHDFTMACMNRQMFPLFKKYGYKAFRQTWAINGVLINHQYIEDGVLGPLNHERFYNSRDFNKWIWRRAKELNQLFRISTNMVQFQTVGLLPELLDAIYQDLIRIIWIKI